MRHKVAMHNEADAPINVLTVSGNPQNLVLLRRVLEEVGYGVIPAGSLEDFDRTMNGELGFNLALVDVTGFDQAIWSRCERLRESDTPLLLIGARGGAALDQAGEAYGAASVLVKPLAVRELVNLIGYLVDP